MIVYRDLRKTAGFWRIRNVAERARLAIIVKQVSIILFKPIRKGFVLKARCLWICKKTNNSDNTGILAG